MKAIAFAWETAKRGPVLFATLARIDGSDDMAAMEPNAAISPDNVRLSTQRDWRGLASMAVLLVIALALVVATVWLWFGPGFDAAPQEAGAAPPIAALPARAVDAPVLAGLPPSSPVDARARNAAAPFWTGALSAAAPFRPPASDTDRARATECLALAALAEAGADDAGQRAVIQVILNRVRHPAFARTVCGVVFEGSQRATGCQFSFTCDGSLARRYGEAAWAAARRRAQAALGGAVFAPVGGATHYHTDWVHPWWSPKLVKLAQVDTHLFFRWPGYWGSAEAARMAYRGGEPDPFGVPATVTAVSPPLAVSPAALEGAKLLPKGTRAVVAMRDATGRANFLLLDPGAGTAGALDQARKLCGTSATCRVMGWTDRAAIPAALPLPADARAQLQFSYSRDPAGSEIVLYGCDTFKGLARENCIPRSRSSGGAL